MSTAAIQPPQRKIDAEQEIASELRALNQILTTISQTLGKIELTLRDKLHG